LQNMPVLWLDRFEREKIINKSDFTSLAPVTKKILLLYKIKSGRVRRLEKTRDAKYMQNISQRTGMEEIIWEA
jgi:Zn-finger nucleic acid-binding protein